MPFEEHVENLDASTEPSPELSTISPAPEVIVKLRNAAVELGLPAAMRVNGAKITKKIEAMMAVFNAVPELLVSYNKNSKLGMEKPEAVISTMVEYVAETVLWGIVTRLAVAAGGGAVAGPHGTVIAVGVTALQITLEIFDADPVEAIKANMMPYFDEIIASFKKDQALASINKEILLETTNAVRGALLLSPKLFGPAFSFLDNHRHAYFQAQDETVRISFLKDVTQNYLLPKYPSLSETLQHLNWSQSDIFSMLENIDFSKSPSQSMPPNVDGLHAWAQQNLGPDFSYPVHESHEAQELQAAPIPISEVVGDLLRAHQWLYGQPSEAQKNDGIKRLETKYLGEFANVLDVLKGGVANKITLSQNLQTAGYGLQLASQLAALTGHSETASILSGVAQSAFGLMSSMALTGLAAGFAGISAVVALPLSIMAFKQSKRQAKAMQAFQQALMSGLQTILNTMVELDYWARIRHEEVRQDIKLLAEEIRKWFETINNELKVTQVSITLLQEHIRKLEVTFERFSEALLSQDFNRECAFLLDRATPEIPESNYVTAITAIGAYPETHGLSQRLIDISDGQQPTTDPLILARAAQCFMLAREQMGREPQGMPDKLTIAGFNRHYESVQRWALGLRDNITNYIGPIAAAIAGIEQIKALIQKTISSEHQKFVAEKIKIVGIPFLQESLITRERGKIPKIIAPEARQYTNSEINAFVRHTKIDVSMLSEKMLMLNFFDGLNSESYKKPREKNFLKTHFYPNDAKISSFTYILSEINIEYTNKIFEFLLMFIDDLKIKIDYNDFFGAVAGDSYYVRRVDDKFWLFKYKMQIIINFQINNYWHQLYHGQFNYNNYITCAQKNLPTIDPWYRYYNEKFYYSHSSVCFLADRFKDWPKCYLANIVSSECAIELENFFYDKLKINTSHPCTPLAIFKIDIDPMIEVFMANQDFFKITQKRLYDYRKRIFVSLLQDAKSAGSPFRLQLSKVNEQLKLAQGRMYFTLTPGLQSNTSQALVTATGLTQTFSPLSPEAIIKFLTDYNGEGDNILDYLTQCQEQLRAWQAQVEALHASFEGSQLTGFPALDFTISALRYRHQHGLINGAAATTAALPASSDKLTPQSAQIPTTIVCYDEQCHEQSADDFITLYHRDLDNFAASPRISNNGQINEETKNKLLDDIETIRRKLRGRHLTQEIYTNLRDCLKVDGQTQRIDERLRKEQSLLTTTMEGINLICAEKMDIADTTEVIYANGAKANQASDNQARWSNLRQKAAGLAVAAQGHMTLGLIANGDNGNFRDQANSFMGQITDRRISPYFTHTQSDEPGQETEHTNANGNYAGSSILSTRTVIVYGADRGIFAARQTVGYLLPHYLMLAAKSLGTSMTDVTQYVTDSIAQLQLATATPSKPETLSDSAHVVSLPGGQLRLSDRPYSHGTYAAHPAFENTIAVLHDMAHALPDVCLAVLQSYINPILWLSDLTRQGLREAYAHAQQMQLRLARALASEVEISDCASPYSTCLRRAASQQPPRVDRIRHLISYHRPSGQAIYTEEALELHSPSNTSRTVGRLSLFGPTLCQFEDGSTNVYEQTGVYADNPIEATIYTEPCTLPRPPEPGVTDGVCHAAAQGCVTGLSQVAYQYMCQEGYKETTSYYVTGIARLAILWFMFAVEHYAETSAMDYESPVTTALMRACLSLLQLLFMMTMSMALVGGTRYAGGLAREAGWARTGHAVESIGAYVAPALTYVDRMRQQGFLNTLACTATGLATQHGVTGIGSHLLGRR